MFLVEAFVSQGANEFANGMKSRNVPLHVIFWFEFSIAEFAVEAIVRGMHSLHVVIESQLMNFLLANSTPHFVVRVDVKADVLSAFEELRADVALISEPWLDGR